VESSWRSQKCSISEGGRKEEEEEEEEEDERGELAPPFR